MKLHITAGSPNCHKVNAVIDHLALDVEIVRHDFSELRGADFIAINPNAKVPVLVDGDLTLWESNAVMQYLADKAGGEVLFPRDPRRRADIARWQFWELAHFNRAFGTLAFELAARPLLDIGPADSELVAAARIDLARFAPALERCLDGRRFLVGDGLTLADYSVATFEAYRGKIGFDWSSFPKINAYFDRMGSVESWARTAPAPRARAA
jgi:glutathione S-transferase